MRLRSLFIVVLLTAACSGSEDPGSPPAGTGECPDPQALSIDVPPGFPRVVSPADNPLTVEGVALGRRLFYDPILSGDSTQACASCHQQQHAFGDPDRFSTGIDGMQGNRHAPTINNPAWLKDSFWDGRTPSLEDQAREPVPNPIEMHLEWPVAVSRLQSHGEYPDLFCAAFGDKTVSQDRIVKAIAQFERTFTTWNSKYDRYRRGETQLTDAELKGFLLFSSEVGDCFHCHDERLFTTNDFHNIGLDSISADPGLEAVTGLAQDLGKFKVPSLRNIMVSAPYMHDGRFDTIEEVFEHYNLGFHRPANLDPLIGARRPLRQGQIDTMIVFLHTLTDSTFLNNPELSNPFTIEP